MKKKRCITLVLCLAMVLVLVAGCSETETADTSTESADTATTDETTDEATDEATDESAEAPYESITIKFGHGGNTDQIGAIYMQEWADMVTEQTDGRIQFEIYPAGQLGTLVEMLEAVNLGTLDMTMSDPSLMTTYLPQIGLVSLPFIIEDYDHAAEVYDGEIGETLAAMLVEESNIRCLGWMWNGFRSICSKVEITTVEDCADILIRSPETDLYMDTFNMLGMEPTPIPFGEMYTAMQSKVVDAVETTPELLYTMGFYELGSYICTSNHIFSVLTPAINDDLWNTLTEEDQQIMMDCMEEVIALDRAEVIANEQGYLDLMADEGATITEFENRQEIIDLFTSYWSEYATEYDCLDILELF